MEPLERSVDFFVNEKKILSCMSVVCGTALETRTAMGGVTDRAGTPVCEASVFDLASLTKLFTGVVILKLYESGELEPGRPVFSYDRRFSKLREATVDQLLGFEVLLKTDRRIDELNDRAGALNELFAVRAMPHTGGRYYSDMHAMVLGLVAETVTGMPVGDLVKELILDPLDMRETWWDVPREVRERCVSYDGEHRIEGKNRTVRAGVDKGTPHDPKARILGENGKYLCGHAGLFSTAADMTKLCRAMLSGTLLSEASLKSMARNRLGRALPGGGWTQHLGSMCYVKHPNQYDSEVPVYMGDRAIALSGFTGNHLSVDPERGLFTVCLGNRVLDRLTVLVPEEGKTRGDYGLNPDGTGRIEWTDGAWVYSSVDYVHQKDRHLHARVAEALGLV